MQVIVNIPCEQIDYSLTIIKEQGGQPSEVSL